MESYHLRYLPLFEQDLAETLNYLAQRLHNPQAAKRLLDDTAEAILKRLENPLSIPPYESARTRKRPYRAIHIRNFIVFYVVIDNVMEVRRFVYGRRDIPRML
jgi:plasmid stabilization system protein ParE